MNDTLYEKIRCFLNENDLFCKNNSMSITRVGKGCAFGELDAVHETHANGGNVVQGGALYTLADFVFAAASCSYGKMAVTMNADISFVRPGKMGRITAEAREINRGSRTGLYEVNVCQAESGKLLLHAVMTAFILEQDLFPNEKTENE